MRREKLRFHQALTLGAPDVTVGPSLLDARPKGVASKGGFGGVKRGQGNHTVPLPPFVYGFCRFFGIKVIKKYLKRHKIAKSELI